MATNTRSNRPIRVSMVLVSNMSVRNSTVPLIPAGSPASVKCSSQGECQVHAGGVGVYWHRGELHIPQHQTGGRVMSPAKFCQANITWMRG